jgi:hypothetical protein
VTDAPFVLTKPGTEAGESLAGIVARKEAERVAGKNIFWWGIGSSLGSAVCKAAQDAGGKLQVLFVLNNRPSRPKEHDVSPARVFRWTKWQDWNGSVSDVPAYAHVTSRGHELKRGITLWSAPRTGRLRSTLLVRRLIHRFAGQRWASGRALRKLRRCYGVT